MKSPNKTVRRRMIEEQDDRNRRMRRPTKGERKRVQTLAKAVFHCPACDRNVHISWEALKSECGTPKCRMCGGALQIATPCLTKGVLPKLRR
jgi:transcription elongation factor Elf1